MMMKRRITGEQLQELTQEQQKGLREWWKPQVGDCVIDSAGDIGVVYNEEEIDNADLFPLFDIGQMIELLEPYFESAYGTEPARYFKGIILDWDDFEIPELCDALWEAVKVVL